MQMQRSDSQWKLTWPDLYSRWTRAINELSPCRKIMRQGLFRRKDGDKPCYDNSTWMEIYGECSLSITRWCFNWPATGNRTLGVSDYSTHIISIANNLHGELLNRVFIHELGHCVMFSYGLRQSFTVWLRNDIGWMQRNLYAIFWQTTAIFVIGTARDILGNKFTYVSPVGAERMIAWEY